MALDQSALLEVLEALKAADGGDRVRSAATTIYQALIEAELTAVIGAGPHQRCPVPGPMEALNSREDESHAAPSEYPDEPREGAVQFRSMFGGTRRPRPGALTRIGEQLGINPATPRNWVTQAESVAGHADLRPWSSCDDVRSANSVTFW